jgi:hypothetical protein
MKMLLAPLLALVLVSMNSQAQPPLESAVSPEPEGSVSITTVRGSIRFENGAYELAHNSAPGEFDYTPLGGDPKLLAEAVELIRKIGAEEAASGNYLYGLYEPLILKVRRQSDGSLVLLAFSRS